MRTWNCYRCGKHFFHARHLVGHLIRLHGEGNAR